MGASAFEQRVNTCRGYACVLITAAAFVIVLEQPKCLLFWEAGGYEFAAERTGNVGLATSAFFLAYLLIDSLVGIFCRHHFRRSSMAALLLHHVAVGIGVAAFALPSPPRGYFLYVLGEALTAARLLPPQPRWHARSAVFVFRRGLWLYLLGRDTWFFSETSQRFGFGAAIVPPIVAALLLALDSMWWREHARNGAAARRPSKEAGASAKPNSPSEDENGRLLWAADGSPLLTAPPGCGTDTGTGGDAQSALQHPPALDLEAGLEAGPLYEDDAELHSP